MAFEIQTSKGTRSILNDEEQPKSLNSSCASIPPIHMESHPYHSQNRYYNPSNTSTPFYRNGSISLPPLPSKSQGYPLNTTTTTTTTNVQYPPRSSALDFYSNPPSPPIVPASQYSYQHFQPMMAPPVHIPHYQQQQIYSLPSPSSPIQQQQQQQQHHHQQQQQQQQYAPTSTLQISHPSPSSLAPTVPVSPVSPNSNNSSDQSKSSTRSKISSATPKPNKKYICSHCSRSFTTSGHLARHTRIHTGEKNYECPHDDCHMRFSRQDNCMQHYRTHLGGRSRVGRGRGRKANNVPQPKPNNPVTTINSLLSNDLNLKTAKFEPIN